MKKILLLYSTLCFLAPAESFAMDKIDQMLNKPEKYLQFCIMDYRVFYKKPTPARLSKDTILKRKEEKKRKKTQFLEQVVSYVEKHPTKGKAGNGKEGVYFCLDGNLDEELPLKKRFRKKKKKRPKISRDLYICIKKSHYEKIAKEYDFLKGKRKKDVTVSDMEKVISHILYDYLGIVESGCLIVVNPISNPTLYFQKTKLEKERRIQQRDSTPEPVSNNELLFFDSEEKEEDNGFDFDFDLKEGQSSALAINNVSIILFFPEGPLKIKEKEQKLPENTNAQPDTSSTKQHASNPTIIDLPGYFRENNINPDPFLSPEKKRSSLDDLPSPQHEDTNNIVINNPLKSLGLLITAGFGISILKNKRLKRPQKKKKKREREEKLEKEE